jgi:hypothetical protein
MLLPTPKKVVKRLQTIVDGPGGLAGFDHLIRLVVERKYWQLLQSSRGGPFECFANFLTAAQPHGLGVDSTQKLQPFLDWLKREQRYEILAEVIEAVRRRRGARKSANIADGDICPRFYTPDRSSSSLDQLLPRLQQYPEWFARVCSGELTPHKAGLELGVLNGNGTHPPHAGGRLRFGVMDLDKLRQLTRKAKLRVACEFFDALDEDTRCGLIFQRIERRLGPGLAERWRNHDAGK